MLSLEAIQKIHQMQLNFTTLFQGPPDKIVNAPGRVNIIGEHTDHQFYPVLPCALEQSISICGRVESDGPALRLVHASQKYPQAEFATAEDMKIDRSRGGWQNYVLAAYFGVIEYMITNDPEQGGRIIDWSKGMTSPAVTEDVRQDVPRLTLYVDGDVPEASGVSSSSALVVASTLAVMHLFVKAHVLDKVLEKLDLARLCIGSERHVGTAGGGMDQTAICMGTKGKALRIDFKPLRAREVIMPSSAVLVVANTCCRAAKTETLPYRYNKRVFELRIGGYLLLKGICEEEGRAKPPTMEHDDFDTQLREVQQAVKKPLKEMNNMVEKIVGPASRVWTKKEIAAAVPKAKIDYLLRVVGQDVWDLNDDFHLSARMMHVYSEALRVDQATSLLAASGYSPAAKCSQLGRLMNESHYSLRDLFENSCPELERATMSARDWGAHGSRMTGAGWGGCCVSLLSRDRVEDFMQMMVDHYFVPTLRLQREKIAAGGTPSTNIPDRGRELEELTEKDFVSVLFEVSPGGGAGLYASA